MAGNPTKSNYKLLTSARNASLDAHALSDYHLSIHVNDTNFKLCCVDPVSAQCLLIETYHLAYSRSHRRLHAIEQLYQEHTLLGALTWGAVTLCIGNQKYTLVPQYLFQEQKVASYLGFTCLLGVEAVRHYQHPALELTVAFAMDTLLLDWFEKTYAATSFRAIHQASTLIEGAWTYFGAGRMQSLPKLLAFVEKNHLHIVVMQAQKLRYYNRFMYANSDELLHYILVVMRTLQLDTYLHEVFLSGDITKRSPSYKKLRNYIRRLTLVDRPGHLKYTRTFTKEMMMQHFDVLHAHACR